MGTYRGTTNESWETVRDAIVGDDAKYMQLRFGKANVPRYSHGLYISFSGYYVARILWSPSREVFFDINEDFGGGLVERVRKRIKHALTGTNLFVEASQTGAFEDILHRCTLVHKLHQTQRAVRTGDWSEWGTGARKFHLGSASSSCEIVLHQTARKTSYWHEGDDLVRLEWRFRPEGEEQRALAATLSTREFFSLSPVARDVAYLVLTKELIRPAGMPMSDRSGEEIAEMLPAVGQSALGFQALSHDHGGHYAILNAMEAGIRALKSTAIPHH